MFSTTRKTLTAALLAIALVAAVTSPSTADSKDDLKKQKKEVSGKVDDAKKDLDQSTREFAVAVQALQKAQASLDAAQATLDRTRGALAVARARDAQMRARLAKSQADLAAAEAKLTRSKAQLKKSESAVEQFTVENLQQGDRGMRAFNGLLEGEDPTTFSEQMSLNDSVSDAQSATMQRLAATRVILGLKRDKVEKLRDRVERQKKQTAANVTVQQRLEADAAGQAAAVSRLVTVRAGARNSASKLRTEDEAQYQAQLRESESLNARLRALAAKELAEAKARAAAAAAAKARADKGGSKSDGGGGGGSTGGGSSGGDGGSTLSYPARGPITSPYGMRKHPITGVYKLHDGTDFGVPCGTPVHAAASGTIVEQYFNGAYGNRVILNNGVMRGKSVVTTYNHLSRFVLSSGSKVKRGQLIAYSGTTGYSTGCHLHFMVITNGYTVNPMGWL